MNKLNKEELIIGFIYGLVSYFAVGFYCVGIACLTSYFWALTGAGESKLYRRLVNPWILALCFVFAYKSIIPTISVPLQFGALSLGYGTKSTQPPDEGSWLGKIFGKWTKLVWFAILGVTMIPLFIH